MVESIVPERDGGFGSFLTLTEFDRAGRVGTFVSVVFARTGIRGCSFVAVFVCFETKVDMDFCFVGGGREARSEDEGAVASSFGFGTHQLPDFLSTFTFTGVILCESFPGEEVNYATTAVDKTGYLQLMLVIATLNFFHVQRYFPPCTWDMTFFTSSNLALAVSPI